MKIKDWLRCQKLLLFSFLVKVSVLIDTMPSERLDPGSADQALSWNLEEFLIEFERRSDETEATGDPISSGSREFD
jgi:hypothetical protein